LFLNDESEEQAVGFRLAHVQAVDGRHDVVDGTDIGVRIVGDILKKPIKLV
jgi:hypothetical protein